MFANKESTDRLSATRRAFIIALLFSFFFIHLPLALFIIYDGFFDDTASKIKEDQSHKEEVVMVDLNQVNIPKPIVDITKPTVQKRPKKASAQSLYNSSVKQETVSQRRSKVPFGQQKKPTPQSTTQKLQKQQNEIIKNKDKPLMPKSAMSMQEQLKMLKNKTKEQEQTKYAKMFKSTPKKAPLFKSQVGAPTGGGGDFLPNFKVGNRTFLNTLSNPHIGYYVELKRKFGYAFNPMRVLKRDSNMISRGQISVIWGLTVDQRGHVKGLTLIRGSGHPAYDGEAKRTIRISAPFSSPPSNMLDKNKELNMAWTFVVYL